MATKVKYSIGDIVKLKSGGPDQSNESISRCPLHVSPRFRTTIPASDNRALSKDGMVNTSEHHVPGISSTPTD